MIGLKAYIKDRQISEVARRSKITRRTLQKILSGHSMPKINTLFKLAEVLDITDPNEILNLFEEYRNFSQEKRKR